MQGDSTKKKQHEGVGGSLPGKIPQRPVSDRKGRDERQKKRKEPDIVMKPKGLKKQVSEKLEEGTEEPGHLGIAEIKRGPPKKSPILRQANDAITENPPIVMAKETQGENYPEVKN